MRVADALIENSGRERTTMIAYAVGWTQHTAGVQMIRSAAILQLLLGNIGRPGGGIMAMRGHASIQGSTDIPTLFDLLPGYLHMPRGRRGGVRPRRSTWTAARADRGWWSFFDTYIVSLLKAWFGDAATPENDFGFRHLPKISASHSHFATMLRAMDGGVDGLFLMGQNPAVGSQHAGLQRRALASLKWLVVRDLAEIESATFWRDMPRRSRAASCARRTSRPRCSSCPPPRTWRRRARSRNTQRLMQWRDKALEPPGDARSELWFMHHLFKRIRRALRGLRARARLADPQPHVGLRRARRARRADRPRTCCREINGYDVDTGEPLDGFTDLRDDGSTACGCWIYSRRLRRRREPVARRRDAGDVADAEGGFVSPDWGFTWPANRHILYNRASADPDGQAVVGAQEVRLVGRGGGGVDGLRRARLPEGQAARLPRRPTTRGHGRDLRRPTRS